LSPISLNRLSEKQKSSLNEYAERWTQQRRSTTRPDRLAAEDSIRSAYAAGDLKPPKRIIWGRSPVELSRSWAAAKHTEPIGLNVKAIIVDFVRSRVEGNMELSVASNVRRDLSTDPRFSRPPAFCTTILEVGLRDGDAIKAALKKRVGAVCARAFGAKWPRWHFSACSFCFHSATWLSAYRFFREACGLCRETDALIGLWGLAEHVEWVMPHEQVCWVSEKSEVLNCDIAGRLHCASGPALQYRDGSSVHAWKGIRVPDWMIEGQAHLTIGMVNRARDPVLRRCMIDIMTPERFISEGGAWLAGRDDAGVLWRREWHWDAWAAVEVVNGTPEKDGSYRRYFLQVPPNMITPRQAVAWTYGLSAEQYRPTLRT
jgi:hypothetical protein